MGASSKREKRGRKAAERSAKGKGLPSGVNKPPSTNEMQRAKPKKGKSINDAGNTVVGRATHAKGSNKMQKNKGKKWRKKQGGAVAGQRVEMAGQFIGASGEQVTAAQVERNNKNTDKKTLMKRKRTEKRKRAQGRKAAEKNETGGAEDTLLALEREVNAWKKVWMRERKRRDQLHEMQVVLDKASGWVQEEGGKGEEEVEIVRRCLQCDLLSHRWAAGGPCVFFAQGRCKKTAEKCRFAHDSITPTPSSAPSSSSSTSASASSSSASSSSASSPSPSMPLRTLEQVRAVPECATCHMVCFCSDACRDKATRVQVPSEKTHTPDQCQAWCVFGACAQLAEAEEMAPGAPLWLPSSSRSALYHMQEEEEESPPDTTTNSEEHLATKPTSGAPKVTGEGSADDDGEAMSDGWAKYAVLRDMPSFDEAPLALATEALSYPLSLVLAVQRLGIVKPGSDELQAGVLRVHLLNPPRSLLNALETWAEVLRLVPSVRQLRLCMVGDAIPEDADGHNMSGQVEDPCGTREFHVSMARDYPMLRASDLWTQPDLAIAFQNGPADDIEVWMKLLSILREDGIPFVCTTHSAQEAAFHSRTARFLGFAHERLLSNPYASLLPSQDPRSEANVCYSNSYMAILQHKKS